ncbi:exodeoxyribonuclease V subunit beta [Endozoicomonas numazuensis]|uniref:exodeoxyribonuclease V subunit beta n=1 Tax=Endozoicomonas numazuensis TaxID=1137799 RepID=UPI00068BA83E|nr:exodeoxyribonuclease V subunit beta [Endozoicomonas numazuensis]
MTVTTPMSIANEQLQLDARIFPLHGNRLIEASAGTGKTYTIANLFLRLVLGHGPEHDQVVSAHCQPLTVDQILVVTFTEAATEELRDRIRARLHQAREAFENAETNDPFIATLMNDLDRHPERARLLLAAERQMDEAAVFTIHGFCQRMLKQHAFESGTLFSNELITDETHLLEQAAADFWRTELYPLSKPLARLARSVWKTPGDLLNDIRGLLGKPALQVKTGSMPDTLERFTSSYVEPAQSIRNLWRDERYAIEEQLLSCGLKKTSKPFKRIADMAAFANSDALFPDLGRNDSWEIYGRESLEKSLSKKGVLPDHPVFSLIENLLDQPASIKDAFKSMMLARSLSSIQLRRLYIKNQKHQMSFDDLLIRLHHALYQDHGEQLAETLQLQFPVAMIDEFQDTDPLQYAIFNRIYPNHSSPDRTSGLFMIGDPKQAIYAFRGADIFTYMQARRQVSAHYSLDTNWRSSSNMVHSVNRVFDQCLQEPNHESRPPFVYRDIPFLSVKPSPKADHQSLLEAGSQVPALSIWWQNNEGTAVGKTDYEQTMTQATASEVNRLLSQAQATIQSTVPSDESIEPLKAGDIAILVRTGRQGLMIREALSKQGISSVYLSSSDSVFASNEAVDVLRILTACLHPGHDRTLRSALATPLLNLSAEMLDALNEDEMAWEQAVEEFSEYHQIWMKQGVLPMLRVLVQKRKLAEQLLARDNGERRLTDLLHVGELLAAASLELESPHALQRWLSEHIRKPDTHADEQQLHLESERNRVQIVTIHKSKGLEYPVVFLPFICSFREAGEPVYHDSQHTTLDLSGDDEALIKADEERLAEDIRLLYVALTRSVHRCYLGMAPVKSGSGRKNDQTDLHRTAIGWLLNGSDILDSATLEQKLNNLAASHPAIDIQQIQDHQLPVFQSEPEEALQLEASEFKGSIQRDWWVTSYSALSRTAHNQGHRTVQEPDASLETAGLDMEVLTEAEDPSNTELQPDAEIIDIFTFPKGARPGTFLHALFENLEHLESETLNAITQDLSGYVLEQLQAEGFDEKWCPTLANMLDHCLNAPLNDSNGLTLGDLPRHAKKVEMEFYLPVSRLRSSELNAILKSEDRLSAQAGLLDFVTVKGMLKGFIDLTFEYDGRWYVLDYKSNWLGEQLSDYTHESMQRVMVEHRYDLQYQLYSLALHRLLKSRLPDYDFEQHFGGVYYLFLRGIRKDESEKTGIFHCRPKQSLIEKLDRLFYGESAMSEEPSTQAGVSS